MKVCPSSYMSVARESFCERLFLCSVVGILLATGVVKLLSSLIEVPVLDLHDPLLKLPRRTVWQFTAVADFAILMAIWAFPRYRRYVALWIGTVFTASHVIVWLMRLPPICPCLGSAAAWLGVSEAQASMIAFGLAIYILVGAFMCLCLGRWISSSATHP